MILHWKKHPLSKMEMAQEMILLMDNYRDRKVRDDELHYVIHYWAKHEADKIFDGPEKFNGTLVNRLGKKRLQLLKKMLDGFQYSLI